MSTKNKIALIFLIGYITVGILAVFTLVSAFALDNVTVSVDKGTTTSCDEVGDIGTGDTYVECRRVDALTGEERQELNNALRNAYNSPDKGDDLIADQLCQFRPYKHCEEELK